MKNPLQHEDQLAAQLFDQVLERVGETTLTLSAANHPDRECIQALLLAAYRQGVQDALQAARTGGWFGRT